jgi:Mor family transcriptional regulator
MTTTEIIEIPDEWRPSIDELPGDLALVASGIEAQRPGQGVELTLLLAQLFKGISVYFRNVDELLRGVRNRAIRADYDAGVRVKELACRYRLSTRQIENILAEPENREQRADRQMKLF